jgi:hypothetical protein
MRSTLSPAARGLLAAAVLAGALAGLAARADDPSWKDEFADICSRTQDAMTIPDAELESLVARGEKIATEIEKLPDTERKVYARRLKACLDLYRFVLESRKAAPPQ